MKDIFLNGQYIISTSNPHLYHFLMRYKKELKRSTPHRRGLIKGYYLVNLDSIYRDGLITENERRAGVRAVYRIYEMLSQ